MELKPIRQNLNVLTFEKDGQEYKVLFSYETPVAYSKLTEVGLLRYKTNQWYSRATSKHINEWFHKYDDVCEQSEIDNLVNSVK